VLRVIGKPSIVSKRSRRPLKGACEFWLRRRDLRLSAPGGRLFPVEAGGRPRGSVHRDGHRRPARGEQPAEARFEPGESYAWPPGEKAGAPYSVAAWASRSIREAAAPTEPAVGSPRAGGRQQLRYPQGSARGASEQHPRNQLIGAWRRGAPQGARDVHEDRRGAAASPAPKGKIHRIDPKFTS
jgi:hypothetical protein